MEITTKEKVIRQSIKILVKKIEKVKHLIYDDYFTDVINTMKEINDLFENKPSGFDKDFNSKLLKLLEKKEKYQAMYDKRRNLATSKLIEKQVKLEFELADLNRELYFIEMTKDMRQSETSNVF